MEALAQLNVPLMQMSFTSLEARFNFQIVLHFKN